ncbi:hypothetical protein BGZ65_000026 [Modicella reniformis]|uniref:Uncharacterized protein n=1 Tax=Modicella reniformis TaxID=1440133 RepID=A0A9P6LSL4_9FUNG|nr:hypothetical protein BGZ65_000026 [Modicella reniformis]
MLTLQNSEDTSQSESQLPHTWGSFQVQVDGKTEIIRFTKQGDMCRAGYVFGYDADCDVILPRTRHTSPRHFVVYKEVMNASECVRLHVLSPFGVFVNNQRTNTRDTVRLDHGDHVAYIQEMDGIDARRICKKLTSMISFHSQFNVGRLLGAGNFARVFEAEEKNSGIVYAVKIVKRNRDFNSKLSGNLEREIGTLMSIDHPNLLRVHKVFVDRDEYFLVTELASGGELFDCVRDVFKFSEPEARHVFRQILNGVKYLHDHGIVHRDLKLENILVMDKETLTVKISDFGLSNVIGDCRFLNTICGTPSYVAPEVLRKEGYGKPVDMWSLGVLFYIFLCGFPPFCEDLGPPRLRFQILENRYEFPSPYWDEVSDEAVNLVQELLLLNTKERLTVDGALAHVWMQLEDDQGTMPDKPRTEIKLEIEVAVARIMTQRRRRHQGSTTTSSILDQP